ncbi:Small proline-rich protein 3, partial [Perkinsus olseni]
MGNSCSSCFGSSKTPTPPPARSTKPTTFPAPQAAATAASVKPADVPEVAPVKEAPEGTSSKKPVEAVSEVTAASVAAVPSKNQEAESSPIPTPTTTAAPTPEPKPAPIAEETVVPEVVTKEGREGTNEPVVAEQTVESATVTTHVEAVKLEEAPVTITTDAAVSKVEEVPVTTTTDAAVSKVEEAP